MAEVSPNLIVMSFVVAFMHLVILFLVRGADGWSTKGFGAPSGEIYLAGFTFTAGDSKQPEGRGLETGGFEADIGVFTEGTVRNVESGV